MADEMSRMRMPAGELPLGPTSLEAVLFDLDGLMIDTERMVWRAFHLATSELGFELPPGLFASLVGRTADDSSGLILEAFGPDFPLAEFRALTQADYEAQIAREGIGLKPGIEPLLDFLSERDVPFACATSSGRERAWWKLHQAGIGERFTTLVGGDEVSSGKPAPDIFLEAARRLGVEPVRCVVLEDSPNGVRAAAAAQMVPIMVPDVVQPEPHIVRTAHAVLDDLHHARELLTRLLGGSDPEPEPPDR